jgi:tetratricopeptide (TPR) repeat protein
MRQRRRSRLFLVLRWAWLAALLATVTTASAAPRRNDREMRAREAYAAGRYQEALDIYIKLYAEELHPNYLRNIGRCYQNLGDPDRAISSFHEYLRKARNLPDDERAEIDGYIGEMEDLKGKRARAAEPPAKPAPTAQTLPERPVLYQRPPPPPDEPAPVYRRWWFWTLIGGAAAAGAVGFALARGKTDLCSPGRNCGP